MKRVFKIAGIVIGGIGLLYLGLVVYVRLNGSGSLMFMDYRYNALITKHLAQMGCADAQYKMGLFCLTTGESEPTQEEQTQAADWFRKAAEKGHKRAGEKLQWVEGLQCKLKSSDNTVSDNLKQEPTLEDYLQDRRNDTALIQNCIERIDLGNGVKCIDMAAHAFAYQGRNIYFNEDFGLRLEYPQDFVAQIDNWGLGCISHGSEIISPDTTTIISISHWYENDLNREFAIPVDTGYLWLDKKTCVKSNIQDWIDDQIKRDSLATIQQHRKKQKIQIDDTTTLVVSDLILISTGRNRKNRKYYTQKILRVFYDTQGNFLDSERPSVGCITVEYPDKHTTIGRKIIGYIKNAQWNIRITSF